MKRLFEFMIVFAVALMISACVGMATQQNLTPEQAFTKEATQATALVDAVTVAADTAVRAGALKGQDATTTLNLLLAARDGINSAKAMAITDPARGLSKLSVVTASLAAVQSYVVSAGAKP